MAMEKETMTPTQSPTPEALKAAPHVIFEVRHMKNDARSDSYYGIIAEIIDRETNLPALKKVVEAAREVCSDTNQANPRMRGEALDALRAALDALTSA